MEIENKNIIKIIIGVVLFILAVIITYSAVMPKYRIYKQDMQGQANLRQQEWEKKIIIEQAKAELESAKLKSDAEVARAAGVAEANKIIGDSLKGNEAYLKYLWINNIQTGENQERIYIPTEAGLPILEAK